MSDGPKKETFGAKFITLDAEEFNRVCRRVNQFLIDRADKAWRKHQKKPTEKTSDNHVEASKDAFAFLHLLELVEHMTEEIRDLRSALSSIADEQVDDFADVLAPPGSKKKTFLN